MSLPPLHPVLQQAARGVVPSWATLSGSRRAHVERVAALMDEWAACAALTGRDRDRWVAAAYLHDALRQADPAELRKTAPADCGVWPDHMLHGPVAALRLRKDGVRDAPLLRAVAYHTVGHPRLDELGRSLYVADFLEPGRPFLRDWRADLRARMPEEIAAVTREVARARIGRLLETDRRLLQSTVDFWNDLVAEGPDNPGSGSSGARAPASGSDPHPPGERSESDSPPAGTPKTGSG